MFYNVRFLDLLTQQKGFWTENIRTPQEYAHCHVRKYVLGGFKENSTRYFDFIVRGQNIKISYFKIQIMIEDEI